MTADFGAELRLVLAENDVLNGAKMERNKRDIQQLLPNCRSRQAYAVVSGIPKGPLPPKRPPHAKKRRRRMSDCRPLLERWKTTKTISFCFCLRKMIRTHTE